LAYIAHMPILNYTTTISEHTSIAEIQRILAQKGAKTIMTDYDKSQRAVSVSFVIDFNGKDIHFRLPANFRGVQKEITRQTKAKKYHTEAQAIKVCWLIIKDWIVAQMAIIEVEQADLATVFLPYAVMNNDCTVSENFQKSKGGEFLLNSNNNATR